MQEVQIINDGYHILSVGSNNLSEKYSISLKWAEKGRDNTTELYISIDEFELLAITLIKMMIEEQYKK